MAAGLDDQHLVPFIGDGCCSDGPAGTGSDHDHIGFFGHSIVANEHLGREIPASLAPDRTLSRDGTVALCRQLESKIGIDRIVEIVGFVTRLPMAIIAGENHALGTRYVLEKIDTRVLQAAADEIFADSRWCQQEKWPSQEKQKAVKRHADFIGFAAFDIGKMFLEIFDHLIGRYRHFAIVKQGLGHRLDHQGLQAIEGLLQYSSPKLRPGVQIDLIGSLQHYGSGQGLVHLRKDRWSMALRKPSVYKNPLFFSLPKAG